MSAPARLWFGHTSHTRLTPFRRSFRHAIAMLEIDIDRLPEAERLSHLFSINRANAVTFREWDHGAQSAVVPLRLWAERRYADAGITLDGGAIRLVTFPRVLGHGFAPISLWLGYGPEGDLRGVIYEVHNTFGETHSYVSAFYADGRRTEAAKEFHVSPFWGVDGRYRFTLRPPGGTEGEDLLALIVENLGENGAFHVASLNLRPLPLTTPAILRWLVTMPMSGIGVLFAIHWQALWIWVKGARYHVRQEPRARGVTLARPEARLSRKEAWQVEAHEDLRKRA